MPYVKPTNPPKYNGPIGVNPSLDEDRMPVIKVTNGDSWILDATVWNPATGLPATIENCRLEFALVENRFACDHLWTGTWINGIYPDDVVAGLVHIKIPKDISSELRRGTYHFSLKVTDYLDNITETELTGYFQVEYEPTSDTHNIPYRGEECQHKTDQSGKTDKSPTTEAR